MPLRLPRPRFTIRRMMVVVAVAAVATWGCTRVSWGWWYYADGWWEAERELWRGEATIYGGGYSLFTESLDEATCLPVRRIFGCCHYKGDFERLEGHNDHIHQYIRWNGLPKNSLIRWKRELFQLRTFYADCARDDPPKRLVEGGAEVVSPDGRNRVQLTKPAPEFFFELAIADETHWLGTCLLSLRPSDSDLVWGPDGSRLALIRTGGREKDEDFEAIDLRTGMSLRSETYYEGKSLAELLHSLSDQQPFSLDHK